MDKLKNQPCYDKDGNFLGWYSRSCASVVFVFCKDSSDKWCVLASERGGGAYDYNGLWNAPCGYLDFNETTRQCAIRECFEETGIELRAGDVSFVGYQDDPVEANRQNVTFKFAALFHDKKTDDFEFSKENNEKDEVGNIKWIRIDDVPNYKWAFGHEKLILEVFNFNMAAAKL